jgi:hypothetical protein
VLANLPRVDIGSVPKLHYRETPVGGHIMDKNLENYVDEAMNSQEQQNGIFPNVFSKIFQAISDYRCGADTRGSYNIRRGVL